MGNSHYLCYSHKQMQLSLARMNLKLGIISKLNHQSISKTGAWKRGEEVEICNLWGFYCFNVLHIPRQDSIVYCRTNPEQTTQLPGAVLYFKPVSSFFLAPCSYDGLQPNHSQVPPQYKKPSDMLGVWLYSTGNRIHDAEKKKFKKSKDQKGCFGYQMILFQSVCFFLSYRLPLLLQPFAVSSSSLCSVRLQTSIYYKPCTPAVSLSTDVQIPDASKFSLFLLYDP